MENFVIEPYDPSIDYFSRHISWCKENKTFVPKHSYPSSYDTYYGYLEHLYRDTVKDNYTAYRFIIDDGHYQHKLKSKSVTKLVAKMCGLEQVSTDPDAWFVTLNFSNEKWNAQAVLSYLRKFMERPYVLELYGVFEFHSKDCHPHFMMRLVVSRYNAKSKIVEKFWEGTLKNYMSDKQKIDVKKYDVERHQPYLQLDKAIEKSGYLKMDIEWRKSNNLPEFLQKEN